jgi:hypothetical protein
VRVLRGTVLVDAVRVLQRHCVRRRMLQHCVSRRMHPQLGIPVGRAPTCSILRAVERPAALRTHCISPPSPPPPCSAAAAVGALPHRSRGRAVLEREGERPTWLLVPADTVPTNTVTQNLLTQ